MGPRGARLPGGFYCCSPRARVGLTGPVARPWPGPVRSDVHTAVAAGQHGRLITCTNRGATGAGPLESIADVREYVSAGARQGPSGGITASRGLLFFCGAVNAPWRVGAHLRPIYRA